MFNINLHLRHLETLQKKAQLEKREHKCNLRISYILVTLKGIQYYIFRPQKPLSSQ